MTFEYQKRDLRDDAVTQSRSGDPLLCPVRAAAAIIQRLRQMGAKPSTFIYKYKNEKGRWRNLKSKTALTFLRDFIDTVDEAYGLPSKDIGLHSIRALGAIAMNVNGVPVYTIMLLGRWSSDAFPRSTRKQVTAFSNNVSRMTVKNPVYHHVPDANREDP